MFILVLDMSKTNMCPYIALICEEAYTFYYPQLYSVTKQFKKTSTNKHIDRTKAPRKDVTNQ